MAVNVTTDQTFEQDTATGVDLIDFGQLGVVPVGCNHQ